MWLGFVVWWRHQNVSSIATNTPKELIPNKLKLCLPGSSKRLFERLWFLGCFRCHFWSAQCRRIWGFVWFYLTNIILSWHPLSSPQAPHRHPFVRFLRPTSVLLGVFDVARFCCLIMTPKRVFHCDEHTKKTYPKPIRMVSPGVFQAALWAALIFG